MKNNYSKAISILLLMMLTFSSHAQAPEKMSFQAVIRNSNDALISNTSVGMRISILQGSYTGTAVYVETQLPTTNNNGLLSIEIGAGTIISGAFNSIDWELGPYFIKTETDPAGGSNYNITSTSQLLSVPYALFAAKSKSTDCTTCDTHFLNANTSDVMTGTLTVNQLNYSPAKTYTAYIGEYDFVPRQENATVRRGYGMGGVHITNNLSGGLAAPLKLPRGATIQDVKLYFYDIDATNNFMFSLYSFPFNGYMVIGTEYTNSSAGFGTVTLSNGLPTSYNGDYTYHIMASTVDATNTIINWPSPSTNMTIRGARVVYSMTTAQ